MGTKRFQNLVLAIEGASKLESEAERKAIASVAMGLIQAGDFYNAEKGEHGLFGALARYCA